MDKKLCRKCVHSMYLSWNTNGGSIGCNHIVDTGISQVMLNEGLRPGERCRGYAPGKPKTRGMALKVKTFDRAEKERKARRAGNEKV